MRIALTTAFVLSMGMADAQSITPEGITSVAGFYANATTTLSFSAGVVIPEFVLPLPTSVQAEPADTEGMDLAIFPNPASTTFQLRLGEPIRSTATVNIFDSVGKLASSVTLQRDEQFIDISTLGNGSYLVQVIADDRTGTQRLVVQR